MFEPSQNELNDEKTIFLFILFVACIKKTEDGHPSREAMLYNYKWKVTRDGG